MKKTNMKNYRVGQDPCNPALVVFICREESFRGSCHTPCLFVGGARSRVPLNPFASPIHTTHSNLERTV